MEITQAGENVSVTLDKEDGEKLRRIIEANCNKRFTAYIISLNFKPSNIYAMLDGRRKLTWKTLEKLLSETELEAECHITITLRKQDGQSVLDAFSQKQEQT